MTPDEHLDCILTFCRTALTACEQRTPGEWRAEQITGVFNAAVKSDALKPWTGQYVANTIEVKDATFIASASIGYESALRSTIAAIEGLRDSAACWSPFAGGHQAELDAYNALTAIRSAWPQLLK